MSSYYIIKFMNEIILTSTIEKIKFFFKLYKWSYIEILDPNLFNNKNNMVLSVKTETPDGRYKISITDRSEANGIIVISIIDRGCKPKSYNNSFGYLEDLNSLLIELFGINHEVKKVITKTIFRIKKSWQNLELSV